MGLGVHLVLRPVRLPPLPLDLGPARGVEVLLDVRLLRASAPPSLQLLWELQRGRLLIRSGLPLPAPLPRLLLPAHRRTLCDVMSGEMLRWTAPVLDLPVFPDRGTRKDRGARSRRWSSSRSLSYREWLRSSDRSRSRRVRSRTWGDRSRSSDCYRSCRQLSRSPARWGGRCDRSRSSDLPRRSRDRSRSLGLSPPSSDHSRSKERGRRARHEWQEGVETVNVSQAPAVSEVPAAVVPPAGGATMAALPSAVQDLARFFLNLPESSSLGAVGGVAGAAALASGVGVQLCPSASSKVPQPGTSSSSSSRPSGGQEKWGGLGVHLVLRPVRLPPLPLDLGPARGVEVLLDVRLLRASAPPSLQLLREQQRGRLLVRSGLLLPAPLPRLLLPAQRRTLCDVMSGEMLRWTAPVLDPPVFPDLRIEEKGRIMEPVLGGGHPLGRCPTANGCSVTGRDLRIAPVHVTCTLALGETGLDPRIDTGLDLLTATDHVGSALVPLLAGEVVVTARGQAISLVVLVDGLLLPLTVRGQRKEDGEPDVSGRRVWRR